MDGTDTNLTFNRERALNTIIKNMELLTSNHTLPPEMGKAKAFRPLIEHKLVRIAGPHGALTTEHLRQLQVEVKTIEDGATRPAAKQAYAFLGKAVQQANEELVASIHRADPPVTDTDKPAVAGMAVAPSRQATDVLSPDTHYQLDDVMGIMRAHLADDPIAQNYMRSRFSQHNNMNGRISVGAFDSLSNALRHEINIKKGMMGSDRSFAEATKHLSALLRAFEDTRKELPTMVSCEQQQAARPAAVRRPVAPAPVEPRPAGSILQVDTQSGKVRHVVPDEAGVKAPKPAKPQPAFMPAAPRASEVQPATFSEPVLKPAALPVAIAAESPKSGKPAPFIRPANYITSGELITRNGKHQTDEKWRKLCGEIREEAAKHLPADGHTASFNYKGQRLEMMFAANTDKDHRRLWFFRDDMVAPMAVLYAEKYPAQESTAKQHKAPIEPAPKAPVLVCPENYISADTLTARIGKTGRKSLNALCHDLRKAAHEHFTEDSPFVTFAYEGKTIAMVFAHSAADLRSRRWFFRDDMVDAVAELHDARMGITGQPEAKLPVAEVPPADASETTLPQNPPGTVVSDIRQQQRRAKVDRHTSKNAFYSTHAQVIELADAHGLHLKNLANPLAMLHMSPESFEETLDQAYRTTAMMPDGERFRSLMDKLAAQHEQYSNAGRTQERAA